MYEVLIKKSANKSLHKIEKSDSLAGEKIIDLLRILEESADPTKLKNAKKLVGYKDRYRWRIGRYRIIGVIDDSILLITIIKISKRSDAYD